MVKILKYVIILSIAVFLGGCYFVVHSFCDEFYDDIDALGYTYDKKAMDFTFNDTYQGQIRIDGYWIDTSSYSYPYWVDTSSYPFLFRNGLRSEGYIDTLVEHLYPIIVFYEDGTIFKSNISYILPRKAKDERIRDSIKFVRRFVNKDYSIPCNYFYIRLDRDIYNGSFSFYKIIDNRIVNNNVGADNSYCVRPVDKYHYFILNDSTIQKSSGGIYHFVPCDDKPDSLNIFYPDFKNSKYWRREE